MQRQVVMAMLKNTMVQCSDEKENDLLDILQGSTLYVELTLDEKYLLLRHIAEFYRSLGVNMTGD
jgi:hypothetical protein